MGPKIRSADPAFSLRHKSNWIFYVDYPTLSKIDRAVSCPSLINVKINNLLKRKYFTVLQQNNGGIDAEIPHDHSLSL